MAQFQSALENHLWQSTLFVCVIALLTLLLRRNRAAVRHGLWLAASVKFLLPFSLLIGIGSTVEWHAAWREAPVAAPAQMYVVVQEVSQPFAVPVSSPLPVPAPRSASRLPAILFGMWWCGFAANLLAWWRRWRRVRAAVRSASPLDLNLPVPVMSGPSRLEPGVFGVFRPILLLPEGITNRLTPAQFQAVVAHELCHVRRRDNLTASIHMLVEAVFWFHPLVWWIERRLVEERERACDEEVLLLAADPQDYAEGIVNVCKFYLESPLACVAGVTGADLKKRVEAIMLNRGASNLNFAKKLVLAGTGMLAVAVPLTVGLFNAPKVRAQTLVQSAMPQAAEVPLVAQVAAPPSRAPQASQSVAAPPRFEVASIRAIPPLPSGANVPPGFMVVPRMDDPQRFRARFNVASTMGILGWAYGVREFQVSGAPEWLKQDLFEIDARAEHPSTEAQMKQMVQALLADRFKLKLHRETKEVSVYALVVGKDGPKLAEAEARSLLYRPFGDIVTPPGKLTAHGATMAYFAQILTDNLDRPVIDKTNLTGNYDFDLSYDGPSWNPEEPGSYRPFGAAIFGPIQKLGLKLEPQKSPVEVLVIDSVDHPTEN